MKQRSLFITYDGLLDPLGASQILPYLRSIARHPRDVHILSFEKPERLADGEVRLRVGLESEGIQWTPLPFTRGGKFAKVKDLARMCGTAIRLQHQHRFGIVHARSYQAAQVACLLKKLSSAKVIFDMRGLWVDERVDGGLWRMDRLPERVAYRTYKRIERGLLDCADEVVVLTRQVLPELAKMAPNMGATISVIPCCADYSHFQVLSNEQKGSVRDRIGVRRDAFLLGYLGSLGTWYMLDEMLRFFIEAARSRDDIELLLITRDWSPEHKQLFYDLGGGHLESRLHVVSASRDEVPDYIGSIDLMLSFIKPAYSKLASSPTKLAEAYACGIPVICNGGIGDVDAQVGELASGAIVDLSDPAGIADVVDQLDSIRLIGGEKLRARSKPVLDLDVAVDSYRRVYESLEAV